MSLNIFRWGSLNTRVPLFTLIIFLLGFWAMALYAGRVLREDMQHSLERQQFSTVSYVAAEINEEMDNRLRALRVAASEVTPDLLSKAPALQAYLEKHLVFHSFFNGGTLVIRIEGAQAASYPKLNGLSGVASADRLAILAELSKGKGSVVKAVRRGIQPTPVIVMAVPVRDVQGKLIGALAGMISLSMPNFLDKIAQNKYGKSGGYLLVSPQQRLIVMATDKTRIMTQLPVQGANKAVDRFIQGYEGSVVYVSTLGVEQLASVKSVPLAGWYVGLELPTAEAFSPIAGKQRRLLMAAILFTLLAGGLTWLMLRFQLSPMFAAMKKLASLSEADQPLQPLPVTRRDEIGTLISGFNRLLVTLGQREAALEASAQNERDLSRRIAHYADEMADLYEHAPCGYHSLDQAGCFQHINETELKWLGYSWSEVVGKLWLADLLSASSISTYKHVFAILRERGEVHDLELELIRKDRTILPVMISAVAVYDEDGNFLMSRSTVYDMTERKKMDHERIVYLKRLEEASRFLVSSQEEARRRLSSELHDRTSPNLAAININLDIIATELPPNHSSDLAGRLEDTRALIMDTSASIRDICAEMRPPLLDYAGLSAALESYNQQFSRRTGIAVQFDCVYRNERYTLELESLLFRIYQEALTNCTKHAQATLVAVTLINGEDTVSLTIIDNGVGFDPDSLGRNGPVGMGLLNMREMAEISGGSLLIESSYGQGTCIAVKFLGVGGNRDASGRTGDKQDWTTLRRKRDAGSESGKFRLDRL
jgi:PAS domain S-box-containing protein